MQINKTINDYNQSQSENYREICSKLAAMFDAVYINKIDGATSKIWHGHPVWFINDNPIVGYSKQKFGIRLMFWSGADFEEPALNIRGAKFKDASIFYNDLNEIEENVILNWLDKGISIQWDYKNIVKRKGQLVRL